MQKSDLWRSGLQKFTFVLVKKVIWRSGYLCGSYSCVHGLISMGVRVFIFWCMGFSMLGVRMSPTRCTGVFILFVENGDMFVHV